jgi:sodium transport system permease protein
VLAVELKGLARDRRALFSALVLPAVLYPLLFLGQGFVERITRETLERREVRVAVDLSRGPAEAASRLRTLLAREGSMTLVDIDAAELVDLEPRILEGRVEALERQQRLVRILLDGRADALIVAREQEDEPHFALRPYYDGTDDVSSEANRRVVRALLELQGEMRAERLSALVGPDPARGLDPHPVDTASPEDKSGAVLGSLLPLIAVFVLLSGGSYAALSAFAGERENGTFETLLVQPVPAGVVVAAKFSAVLAAGIATLVVNAGSSLSCLALGLGHLPFDASGGSASGGSGAPGATGALAATGLSVSAGRLFGAAFVFLPAAVLVCALLCAFCGRARTFRQGQQVLLPLMLVALVPTLLATQPEVEMDALLAAVPLAGPALALRDALRGAGHLPLLVWMFAANSAWAVLALAQLTHLVDAERVFSTDDIDRESGSRRIQSRYALRFGCVAVFLVYVAGSTLQAWSPVWGLASTLWILLPALALFSVRGTARRAGESIARALTLNLPLKRHALGAVLLAPALARAAQFLFEWQKNALPLPAGYAEVALPIELQNLSPLAAVLLLAVSPAITEELFCRGALLSGLKRDLGYAKCMLYEALIFGALHASIYRFVPTAVVGAILTAVALRARSLWPGVLLHAAYNALVLLQAQTPCLQRSALVLLGLPGLLLLAWPSRRAPGASR